MRDYVIRALNTTSNDDKTKDVGIDGVRVTYEKYIQSFSRSI